MKRTRATSRMAPIAPRMPPAMTPGFVRGSVGFLSGACSGKELEGPAAWSGYVPARLLVVAGWPLEDNSFTGDRVVVVSTMEEEEEAVEIIVSGGCAGWPPVSTSVGAAPVTGRTVSTPPVLPQLKRVYCRPSVEDWKRYVRQLGLADLLS